MSRKNIFDTLTDKYDIGTELQRITTLFNSKSFIAYDHWDNAVYEFSLEEIADKFKFYDWKSRGTCLSCHDMKDALGLQKNPEGVRDINSVLNYLEYYINIYLLTGDINGVDYEYKKTKNYNMFLSNIKKLLDKINHEFLIVKEEEKILIVPKNSTGIAASEISSEQTGIAILKYHHRLLKGDVSEKRKILQTIANEYEVVLKSGTPTEVFGKTKALLNKLGIRHGDKENKANLAKLSPDELEHWYDELYQMLLLCILLNDNSTRMPKVDELLVKLKQDNT